MSGARKKEKTFERFQFKSRVIMDTVAILFAWFFSYYVRFFVFSSGNTDYLYGFFYLSALALVSGYLFLYSYRLYDSDIVSNWRREVERLARVSLSEFLFFVFFYYYVLDKRVSRVHLALYFVMVFLFLVFGRYFVNVLCAKRIREGKFKQRVLLVGYGDRLREYCRITKKDDGTSRLVVAGQYLHYGNTISQVAPIRAHSIAEAVEITDADVVVISFPHEMKNIEYDCIDQGMELFHCRVFTLPGIPKSYVGSVVSDFHGIPTLQINAKFMTSSKLFFKRSFDIVSCTAAVILLSPLYLFIAMLVKLSSPGPVFFKQKRVTKDGKVFEMLKFRSMRNDMPEGEVHWTEENDPRVTKIGKILRKTSLDEIPQFFNVIAGTMSLIGPRPERPELEDRFNKYIPGYAMRHRMKAGISGWAQVNGLRGNTSLEKRIDYDLYYVRNWSLWFDMRIVILTFFKGFVNKNAY